MGKHDGITLSQRTYRALEHTDRLPPKVRECVHEFGYPIVSALLAAGITKPEQMRSLVHNIWLGARQQQQRNPNASRRSPVLDSLDWLLAQNNAGICAATLLWHLKMHNMVILPREPSTPMLNASMSAIEGMQALTKPTKHRLRLRAAIDAGAASLWPHLYSEGATHPLSPRIGPDRLPVCGTGRDRRG